MTTTDAGLSIAQVAESTGLTTHTLRYYERAGLIGLIDRASSSHRRYTEADVNWVVFLTKLRATGMPIAQVREYADLVRRGESTTQARMDLLLRHRVAVLAQLDEVTQSLAAIDKKIEIYKEKCS
ncbi:MerR family transcriptional regulator [Leifsonia sp. H3M29-4]|uniref:MerR family transcriptional regulator n=1 Tax=Salinibacterium metalliresistens TaxID=3031321 RepID=UPI0023DAD828|nr:MerR family transcriptional regulator [Salinibacterium metalliresistens]MDF1479759.1 MerR family transcriptional regulator [Salinibacterium metalliresistens]